jgi:hypothetical protein
MQCPQCQHDNPSGARFCNGCGAKLESPWPQCGQTNPPGGRFCNTCSQHLGSFTASPAPPPSARSHTPVHLAERIINSRNASEGECKQMPALFADLGGSMELLADRDSEEARALLDPVLQRMMEAVHHPSSYLGQYVA